MNYQEWLTKNPGRSINEYYKEFPVLPNASIPKPTIQPTFQNQYAVEEEEVRLDIGNIIFSLLILAGFVLPWVDIKVLGVLKLGDSSGFDLPEVLLNFVDQTKAMKIRIYSIYLIPIGAILSLFGETIKNELVRSLGQILALCSMILWIYVFYTVLKSANIQDFGFSFFQIMSYGFFASVVGCIFYFYDVIIKMR
jgi:hypothetical protein